MPNIGEVSTLAIIQGVTEFLPISSSAHLALVEILFGWKDRGVVFEIAVHLGTLLAVLFYFHKDLVALTSGARKLICGRNSPEGHLFLALVIATFPILPAGLFLLQADWRILFHAIEPIAWINLVFAVFLYLADRCSTQNRDMHQLPLLNALFVGIAQILALFPGVSRAGITITMGRVLGYPRDQAARFSMLLAIPTIIASGAALLSDGGTPEPGTIPRLLFAATLAFLTAYTVIALFLRMMTYASLLAFVLYRVCLSVVLLGGVYFYFP